MFWSKSHTRTHTQSLFVIRINVVSCLVKALLQISEERHLPGGPTFELWLLVSSVCVCVCDQKGVMLTHQCRILCSVPSFFPHTRWTVTLPFRPMWGLLPRSSSIPTCDLLVRTQVCIIASEWPVRVCFECSTGEIVALRLPSSTTNLGRKKTVVTF